MKMALPTYSNPELTDILNWLRENLSSLDDKDGVGSLGPMPDKSSYFWRCHYGRNKAVAGKARSKQQAKADILRCIQPKVTRRKITILNPMRQGR